MKNIVLLFVLVLMGCQEAPLPKPLGFFRIGLPAKEYTNLDTLDCPFSFDVNNEANIDVKPNCWADVEYPSIRATIKLTYYNFEEKPLDVLLKDSQRMAYSHTVKADGMNEQLFLNDEKRVYGVLYQMRGQVATSTQFFMTDSTDNFLRGVLYFYSQPNPDSLKPVNDFMKSEIVNLIETLEWKNG